MDTKLGTGAWTSGTFSVLLSQVEPQDPILGLGPEDLGSAEPPE